MKVTRLIAGLAFAAAALPGCGGDDDTAPMAATATVTSTTVPSATPVPPSRTPTSTASAEPTATPSATVPPRTPTASRTPTSTVTQTATPTRTLSLIESRIRDVVVFASDVCPPPMHLGPYLTLTCGEEICRFDCDYFSGHGGGADLKRFATSEAASTAFDDYRLQAEVSDLHGLPAFFAVYPWSGIPAGSLHSGAFHSACWLATASSYDQSEPLIGAPPSVTLELIYQRATEIGLFEDCD